MKAAIIIMMMIAVLLLAVVTTPLAYAQSTPFTIANRNTIGGATQIVSEADGTTIWNFLIHANSPKTLTFELLMEADTPVYPIFEVMDGDGVVTSLDAPSVLPGRVVESLDDLTTITSEPLDVGDITSHEFLTINIFLFKDPNYSILYENGHIVTMMRIDSGGGYNCYQQEEQCMRSYTQNFGNPADAKIPWGWKKDMPERPGWSYNGLQYVVSQNVARHFQELPPRLEPSPDLVITSNQGELAFGETITVGLEGRFVAATALLYHVDVNGAVSLVALDQANPQDRSIDFKTPDRPNEEFQAGEYWLYLNLLDVTGAEVQQKLVYQIG